tara:strand:- start:100 stop:720 length:621 start_codon:yes stop_codon:yes gene_type:complete
MKTIIITGQSATGKSFLTNKLSKIFKNSIVIKTDSYYRDNILIKLLSIFRFDIYDRILSFKRKEIMQTIYNLYNKTRVITSYSYDFKKKKSKQTRVRVNYNGENQFLILEGIFAHRLDLNYKETINILCIDEKEICFKRRLKRDQRERGRNIIEVNKRFSQSWYLFYKNIKTFINSSEVIKINPVDQISYDKLIINLKNISKNKKN